MIDADDRAYTEIKHGLDCRLRSLQQKLTDFPFTAPAVICTAFSSLNAASSAKANGDAVAKTRQAKLSALDPGQVSIWAQTGQTVGAGAVLT